jgi:MFS family permease
MQISVYYVGSILSSWVTYGCLQHLADSHWSWRAPVLIQCAFPAIMLGFLIFIPESPRWLIAKGRTEEARKIFAKQHANGDENDPLVNLEVEEVHIALDAERSNKTGWSALWATKGNRKRMFIVITTAAGAQLNGVGIIRYVTPSST